jgi:protein TonB
MLGPIVLTILLGLAVTAQSAAVAQPPAAPPQTPAETPWPPVGVSRPGGDVTPPRLISEAKPRYTPEAMRAKIQGFVEMEAIVLPDGTVGEIRVTRSLDRQFGLDDQAVSALKTWRFRAGTRNGVAVPVLVEVEMSFTLRK